MNRAWGHVFSNHICGDYVEFGVYHGSSFVESYNQYKVFECWLQGQLVSTEEWRRTVAQHYCAHKPRFHGLDTFAGMPVSADGNAIFAAGTFASSHAAVRAKCLAAGMSANSFALYEGLFADTTPALTQHLSPKLTIANIDCDIYGSAVDALTAIRDRLQLGCVLMFNDYNIMPTMSRVNGARSENSAKWFHSNSNPGLPTIIAAKPSCAWKSRSGGAVEERCG